MELGMVGPGRTVQRRQEGDHRVAARCGSRVAAAARRARGVADLAPLAGPPALRRPIGMTGSQGAPVTSAIDGLGRCRRRGDALLDGADSRLGDSGRPADRPRRRRLDLVGAGDSGGDSGLSVASCLVVGGGRGAGAGALAGRAPVRPPERRRPRHGGCRPPQPGRARAAATSGAGGDRR